MNCEHYLVNNTNLEAYGLSITGNVRKANEDSCGFATVPNGELFVVCDGMGGHVGGATASRIAVEQIKRYFEAQLYPNIYDALRDALCLANRAIIEAANAEPSLKGMGTTACIVLVHENDAYIAHVGDSRIYLFEADRQRLFRITKDHSFVQSLVDMGQLDDRDAEHHPRKNVIMKALGTKDELHPEVYMSPVQPAKGDMFLICSDGLSGMIDDNAIEAIMASDQSTEQKVLDLVNNANVPGKGLDNITAQVIKVVESPYPPGNHPDHNPHWRNEPDGAAAAAPEANAQMPPQEVRPAKKPMSSKLLALIIVGGILLIGATGAIAFYILKNDDSIILPLNRDDKDLNQRKEAIEKEIINMREDSAKYQTVYDAELTKFIFEHGGNNGASLEKERELLDKVYKTPIDETTEKLKKKRKELERIEQQMEKRNQKNEKSNNTNTIEQKNNDVKPQDLVQTFALSTGETYEYEGEKDENGIPNGGGKASFSNRVYEGHFKDGNLDGEGVLFFISGEKKGREYKARFKDNHIVGQCTVKDGNSRFEGFLNDSLDYYFGMLVNLDTKESFTVKNGTLVKERIK